MSANAVQVGGDHYQKTDCQPWDLIARNSVGFLEGSIMKYLTRWSRKNGRQDLEKCQHFLLKIEELHETGYEPTGEVGPRALTDYFKANGVTDFREKIAISIMANKWTVNQLNHAALLIGSLIESARDGEASES